MATIAVSSDGNYIFLALENGSGNQVIAKAARSDLATWTAAYNPGGGTAANVAAVPGNPDQMIFYGCFGSGIQVIRHTISTVGNANISPTGLTTKVVNCLAVNPSDPLEMWATVDSDQDLKRTVDGGANWTNLNTAIGCDATALETLWSGAYMLDRGFLAGDVGATSGLLYTPNEGATTADQAGATLGAVANITNVETSEI